ncbi:RNA polymerase sigma factor [Luteolibacter yonseiensis]|uniref:RNA polymerase sigma factor n=1 Tax=Luteolibacter yonseiensis TaxID=1144680 RepID=A0A934R328_9BACT|nr:RNA polymerase sigma factor [Luteolibacter yonseiensis]MBK1816131.1 RNA polymerase sigma factor [Luteolibacter yonseiensis]
MGQTTPSDPELLKEWLGQRREAAFNALVARYAGLVHATARRTCGDDSMAGEVSQLTFITLARKAKSLTTCASLGGWLHTTALMQAKNLIRKSQRENRKRQLFQTSMETGPSHSQDEIWKEMQPVLDDALASLSKKDREALLLRFYRSLTVREIATTLGIATDAAQKRIDRATGRLRGKLARRGCVTGGSLAAAMLAGFATDSQAAAPLISKLASKAIVATTTSTVPAIGFITLITTTAMKTTSIIAPLASLIGAALLIEYQRHSIADVEHQGSLMRDRLAMNMEKVARSSTRLSSADERSPIDWKELVSRLNDEVILKQFEKRVASMSVEELTRSIREVNSLNFTNADRSTLENKLHPRLVEIDPEAVLVNFGDQIGKDDNSGRMLRMAFGNWIKKDQARAILWLDEQIAAGRLTSKKLDGSGGSRAFFETYVISALLRSDPAAAKTRAATLGEEDRKRAIQSIDTTTKEIDPLAFARLAREGLSESECNYALSLQASARAEGDDCSKVSEYFDQIEATSTERAAAVRQVIGGVSLHIMMQRMLKPDDVDAIRAWVSSEAPQQLGEVTGYTLGLASFQENFQMKFPEALELINQYYESGDGESILFHFLDTAYPKDEPNRMICRKLAEKITDKTQRESILERFK